MLPFLSACRPPITPNDVRQCAEVRKKNTPDRDADAKVVEHGTEIYSMMLEWMDGLILYCTYSDPRSRHQYHRSSSQVVNPDITSAFLCKHFLPSLVGMWSPVMNIELAVDQNLEKMLTVHGNRTLRSSQKMKTRNHKTESHDRQQHLLSTGRRTRRET